jgi:hypothetical protein
MEGRHCKIFKHENMTLQLFKLKNIIAKMSKHQGASEVSPYNYIYPMCMQQHFGAIFG